MAVMMTASTRMMNAPSIMAWRPWTKGRGCALRKWLAPVLLHLTHLHILAEPEATFLVDFGAKLTKLTNLTTLTLDRDDFFQQWHPLEAADLITLAQLPHLAHLECDVVESWEWMENDKHQREMWSQVEVQRPDSHGSGVVDLIQTRLGALELVFPALVTAKCSALFFVSLAPMTLPSLRTAHVKATMATWSGCQFRLLLPPMPALRVLQFDLCWEDERNARQKLWTVPSTTISATAMPHLETLICLSRIMDIPGLAHPNLHNLVVSVPAWKRLTDHAVDLPLLTNVTITGGDLGSPRLTSLHALMPDGGMPIVARVDVNCQEAQTVTAAEQLTRVRAPDIRRRCEVHETLTVVNTEFTDVIRIEYTATNARAWELLCKSTVISSREKDPFTEENKEEVPVRKIEVTVAPEVDEIDWNRLETLAKWAGRLCVFAPQVIVVRMIGGREWVETVREKEHRMLWKHRVSLVVVDPSKEM
ncbi:hypothetical protein GGF32_006912 [Allomyces javanicus]|nr:hypothetical protein GGF32_006912 [Allomyces javanicus]